MKKIVILFLIAIILGATLGIYSYQKFNEDNAEPASSFLNEVYAFQVGVFESVENAKNMANNYKGIIVKDDKYRVYVALTINNLNNLKIYFDQRNIAYYVKNIYIDNKLYKIIQEYDVLLSNTNMENYESIIDKILKEYDNYENNN